ncbi:tol-pal system protein YbgF [Zavarzinia compransoris]|uniref:Cell division coordinator CpoB n=1 Tax=Zavarzinia compransoris TaxID=1264899 RepID=A0A317EAC0_9PROT|nr:tol-pal system protein YbgF [Zavarzinia compransoris]PWR22253.1 tol-pal system protein YbgF [Zavarzinia compransoris]TDP46988.1 tol-pal system protein YbgF [Zavarzinia compransoris]
MPCLSRCGLSRRVSRPLLALGVVIAAGWGLPAAAQGAANLGALRDKVQELAAAASDIRLAQSTMAPAAAAQMDLRLSALEEEIRSLTGRIEEAQNAADRNDAQLKRFQEDVEFRLNRLEQGAGTATPGTAPPAAAPATPPAATAAATPAPAAPARGNPSPSNSPPDALAAYDAALGMLRRGEYVQAEAALKAFLSTYGSDRLAGNAQYWLGETFYARGNYEAAAQAFLTGVKTYPDGAKAPDTFLKLGISLVQMGQKDKGCQVLRELPGRYPDAAATIKSRAERGLRDGSCT